MIAAGTATKEKGREIASTLGGARRKRAELYVLPSFALTCSELARVAWGEGRTFLEPVARRLCQGSRMSHGCVGGFACSVPSRCWTSILDRKAFHSFGKCDEPLVLSPMTRCRRRWGGGCVQRASHTDTLLRLLAKRVRYFSRGRSIAQCLPPEVTVA